MENIVPGELKITPILKQHVEFKVLLPREHKIPQDIKPMNALRQSLQSLKDESVGTTSIKKLNTMQGHGKSPASQKELQRSREKHSTSQTKLLTDAPPYRAKEEPLSKHNTNIVLKVRGENIAPHLSSVRS